MQFGVMGMPLLKLVGLTRLDHTNDVLLHMGPVIVVNSGATILNFEDDDPPFLMFNLSSYGRVKAMTCERLWGMKICT